MRDIRIRTDTLTHAQRVCRGCGALLSRFNADGSCRACVIGTTRLRCSARFQAGSVHPLRRVRLRRGMTLTTLAGLSGLSASFLCRIENGQRELCRKSHLQALASALPGTAGRPCSLGTRRTGPSEAVNTRVILAAEFRRAVTSPPRSSVPRACR